MELTIFVDGSILKVNLHFITIIRISY